MADYSTRLTKRVRSNGDVRVEAGDQLNLISNGTMEVNGVGGMTLKDPNFPNGVSLADCVSEVVIKEVIVQGTGVALANRYYDACEQEFQGTGNNDYLIFSGMFEYQDSAGTTAPDLRLTYQQSTNDGSYTPVNQFDAIYPQETTTPWSVIGSIGSLTSLGKNNVKTRLFVTTQAASGAVISGKFMFRHVKKLHDFTLSSDFSQSTV